MDRVWLLTWRTYGTWLPGDPRGSVTRVWNDTGPRVVHNGVDTHVEGPMPALEASARLSMKGEPILLDTDQALALAGQFEETARYRGWHVFAGAVMANHVHLVVGVSGDPDPNKLLGDFKAWGSRRLNTHYGKRPNGTWWADAGSTRKLPDESAVADAVEYVLGQSYPLKVWANGPA